MCAEPLAIRRARAEDEPAVLALLQASLEWLPDGHHAAYRDWKHRENPFGVSPAWVAVDGERVVGFRTFMRWEFDTPAGLRRAVRAVDTATSPAHRGRGVFSRLTSHALDEVREEGVDFVFNTPNDASRPGYLKLGWELVGRLPVSVRVRRPTALWKMARARVRAERWSLETDAASAAADALADTSAVTQLLASQPPAVGIRTRRTPEYLAWRYAGFSPLRYRAVVAAGGVENGVVFFRLRRRGPATEAVICDALVPDADSRARDALIRRAAAASGADYVVRLGQGGVGAGFLTLPRQGPRLTWRAVCEPSPPPLPSWALTMGDIELF